MSVDSVLGYTGCFRDRVTAAYPLGQGYRWYLPELMRFSAPDHWSPFGLGGTHPYLYCGANPIDRSDPNGHMWSPTQLNRELEGMFESDRDAGGAIAANDAGHATRSPPSSGFSTPTRVPGTPTRSDPVHAFLRDWQPPAEWRLGERQVSPVPLTETEFDPASPAQHDPGSPASTIAYLGSPSPPPSELPTFREVMREAIDRRAEISLPEVRLYWPNPSYDDALSRQQLTLSLVRVLQENRVPARYLQGNLPIDTLSRRLGYGSSTLGKMRISYQDQVDLGKPVFERKAELLWWLGYIE